MSARRDLYAALMQGGPHSPQRSEKASELIDAFRAEVADELAPGHRAEVLREAIAAVEDPGQRALSPIGMGLGWESARDVLRRMLHETVGRQITGYAHGAWTPNGPDQTAEQAPAALDLHSVILTAVQSFQSSAQAAGSWSQQLAEHLLTAVAPLVPYREVWSAELPPGGAVCGTCGQPVESEPCPDHAPKQDPAAPDFFQAGRTYRSRRCADLRFECLALSADPDTGDQQAIGWRYGPPHNGVRPHRLAALDADDWACCDWTEIPEDGAR